MDLSKSTPTSGKCFQSISNSANTRNMIGCSNQVIWPMIFILSIFGDSITTDHISPAGNISSNSPAAAYLSSKNVKVTDFNSYGARRGNHEVMVRGTFANTRIKNEILLLSSKENIYMVIDR